MDLTAIKELLQAEGFEAAFQTATTEAPVDQLFVLLNLSDDASLALEMLYVPGLDEELEGTRLLQYFVRLPFEVDGTEDQLSRLLAQVNAIAPLVGFGMKEQERMVYFRHVAVMPRDAGVTEAVVIKETVWLINYLVDTYLGVIGSVASGRQTAADELARGIGPARI